MTLNNWIIYPYFVHGLGESTSLFSCVTIFLDGNGHMNFTLNWISMSLICLNFKMEKISKELQIMKETSGLEWPQQLFILWIWTEDTGPASTFFETVIIYLFLFLGHLNFIIPSVTTSLKLIIHLKESNHELYYPIFQRLMHEKDLFSGCSMHCTCNSILSLKSHGGHALLNCCFVLNHHFLSLIISITRDYRLFLSSPVLYF